MPTYTNLKDMPDSVRAEVSDFLTLVFSKTQEERGSWREIAKRLNTYFSGAYREHFDFTGETIRDIYRRRMRGKGKGGGGSPPPENAIYDVDTPPAADLEVMNASLRDANGRLYRQLQASKARNEDLVAATLQGARDAMAAYGPIEPTILVPYNKDAGNHSPEAALWHMTDWQGAKLTTSYNSDIMVERVMRFCKKAFTITEIQRQDHPVTRCVICFGGDMVEGLFNFPTQAFEIDQTIFGQYTTVSRLLIQVVQYALSMYDEVEVIAEWGNHGRIGSKRDNVPRHDNFDRMCYEFARQMLKGENRLVWADCPEDIQRVEIGNYRALSIHGDEIGRNGFASINTIVQHANRWRSGAYPWTFRDVYVGHYHTHYEYTMANGEGSVYGTGSTESDNRYANITLAANATPSQRLHFIDMERGRVSAQYKVFVDGKDGM